MIASISHRILVLASLIGVICIGPRAAGEVQGDAVSSAAATPRHFEINAGLVVDAATRLVWQRCSVGQRWSGEGCIGVVRQMSWQDAKRLEKDGWRLPTREELMTLVKPSNEISIDEHVFPDMEFNKLWYWSGTSGGSSAWYVAFGGGSAHLAPLDNRNAVRLVKGG